MRADGELTGDLVRLRAVAPSDLTSLEEVFATPEVARWWPRYDRARLQAELLEDDDPDATEWVIEVDGAVAGLIQCYEKPDRDYRSAGIDIAVDPRWHGRGVGPDAISTLARHLLDDRGHHRLTIDPAADNARAIAAYTKVGFRPVGTLRRYERGTDGTWHDGLLMDLLAGELQ
ncbi:MAG: GNAT family N-acetyltransferase [Acidimicrobiales bacterium]